MKSKEELDESPLTEEDISKSLRIGVDSLKKISDFAGDVVQCLASSHQIMRDHAKARGVELDSLEQEEKMEVWAASWLSLQKIVMDKFPDVRSFMHDLQVVDALHELLDDVAESRQFTSALKVSMAREDNVEHRH